MSHLLLLIPVDTAPVLLHALIGWYTITKFNVVRHLVATPISLHCVYVPYHVDVLLWYIIGSYNSHTSLWAYSQCLSLY